jgi:hypothetical protein
VSLTLSRLAEHLLARGERNSVASGAPPQRQVKAHGRASVSIQWTTRFVSCVMVAGLVSVAWL